MNKILMLIMVELILLVLAGFLLYEAFHGFKKGETDRVVLILLACFCFVAMIIWGLGFMTAS